jgi:hypothetical protein
MDPTEIAACRASWSNLFRTTSGCDRKERKGLWKMPSLWKSAKTADSHRDLEKPSAFPHFPQALLGYIFMVEGIHLRYVDNWS